MEYIPTNCTCLDTMMGGGLPRGQLTLVYGESKTGKTTISLQCAISASRNKLQTLYLDCENNFSIERLSQIASTDYKAMFNHIFVTKLQSFQEQARLIENLDLYLSKSIALIVVDTITSLYRLELRDPSLIFSANRKLNRQLAYLNHVAKVYNVAILLTSQVHNILDKNDNNVIEPVATRVLTYWAHNILNMSLTHHLSSRRIQLNKHYTSTRTGAYCTIQLTTQGITTLNL